jgi:hypothetical protein
VNTARSFLSLTLWAHSDEPAVADQPPKWPDLFIIRPALILPGGVRVCVDHTMPDAAAARWFDRLAVEATYAALWLKDRNQDGPR